MTVAGAALTYFALVFGAGFLLGIVRVLWVAPRAGERVAELIEMPMMLVVTVLAARATVPRVAGARTAPRMLAMGMIALALMALCELGVALGILRVTLAEYVASRDRVTGTLYLASLALFTVMPVVVSRGMRGTVR